MTDQDVTAVIDSVVLAAVVRQALHAPDAEVVAWRLKPLGGGMGAALGAGTLHRVVGTARHGNSILPWSLVRKRLRPPASGPGFSLSGDDPETQTYWKREALLYDSDLLKDLPAGFSAPRCYCIDERPDGIVLWLEDINDALELQWSLKHYGEVARHLGLFNGAYLTGRPLPDAPWLCRDMLRWREPVVCPFWERLAELRAEPSVQRGWPGNLLDRANRVWTDRERFYTALAMVPQVLCHGDADRRNLMVREGPDGAATVAVDWAQVGPQAVAFDAASLSVQGVFWTHDREPDELSVLSEICFEEYLVGLREAGWVGDDHQVQLGFSAALALRYVALTAPILAALAGEMERPRLEAAFGMTLEEVLDRNAAMLPFLLDVAEGVGELIDRA